MNYDKKYKILRISPQFNEELKDLPEDVLEIYFDMQSYQEIKEIVLLKSLHKLILGFNFNQEIKENILPKSLHILKISREFQKNIIMPESVKEIYMESYTI